MKTELKLYKALGISEDNEVKMIDYFFSHEDGFKGVTGSSFYFISPEEIEERNDLDNVIDKFGYIWQEAVSEGQTTESQEDYMQSWLDGYKMNGDGLFICHDTSHVNKLDNDEEFITFANDNMSEKQLKHLWDEERGTFECVGGGRCFNKDEGELESYVSPERKELHVIARMFEAGKISINEVENFLIKTGIEFKKVVK